MADLTLTPSPPLDGYDRDFGHLRLRAPPGLALVALAFPTGGEDAARAAITKNCDADLPAPGRYTAAPDGTRLIWMAPDLIFAAFEDAAPDAADRMAQRLGEAVRVTDQSDGWVALSAEGAGVCRALERICPLDLHPEAFPPDAAQRTVMEHLGVLILCTGADAFLLLSASSSAESFRHALEVSAANTG